jgi:hypothetical protein
MYSDVHTVNFQLSKLSPHHTWHIIFGVSITEESLWVGFDLSELESVTLVKTGFGIHDACHKRPFHASLAVAGNLGVVANGKRVGECDSGWSRSSLSSLVDVSSSQGR